MWRTRLLVCFFGLTLPVLAQCPTPSHKVEMPMVLPGEGMAIAGKDGVIHSYGEATRETPMGSLAKLLWMRLEGDEWATLGVEFKCTGEWNGHRCWLAKGHGRLDL